MNLEYIAEVTSILMIVLIVYPFIIYPIILKVLASIFNNSVTKNYDFKGDVTVLIAAYNEESTIENCIKSIYNSNYPKEKIKVLVGSDGSSDKTHEIIERLMASYDTLNYYIYERSGKNFVLNKLVKNVDTEFLYVLDADCRLNQNTLKELMANFAVPEVSAVFSPVSIVNNQNIDTGQQGEKIYQQFEKYIRYTESKISSTVNSLNSCLIKTKHVKNIPNNLVCDDFYYVLNVIKENKRILFDTDTFITEVREKSTNDEFNRRIRLVSGGLSTIAMMKKLFLPKYGFIPFFLFSHKLSKWLSPFYLIVLFIATLFLPSSSFREFLLISQYFLYASSLIAFLLEKTNFKLFFFKIPLFYVSMNISFLFGWFRFFSGKQNAIWDRAGLIDE